MLGVYHTHHGTRDVHTHHGTRDVHTHHGPRWRIPTMVLGWRIPTMVPGIYTHHGTGHIHPPWYIPPYTTPGIPTIPPRAVLSCTTCSVLAAVQGGDALGSDLRLITEVRRREASILPKVWKTEETSAQSCSLSPVWKDGKIG